MAGMGELPAKTRFDETYLTDCEPIDWDEYEHWARLSPGARIQAMFNAQQLVFGLIRGRLRRRHPDFTDAEITRAMWTELGRGY